MAPDDTRPCQAVKRQPPVALVRPADLFLGNVRQLSN
jgi:hypothetical protein